MNPKEKAKELVEKFQEQVSRNGHRKENTKSCALICVQECIDGCGTLQKKEYWEEVKSELSVIEEN